MIKPIDLIMDLESGDRSQEIFDETIEDSGSQENPAMTPFPFTNQFQFTTTFPFTTTVHSFATSTSMYTSYTSGG